MIVEAASIIEGDMGVCQPKLTILNPGVGIPKVYLSCPDRFNLSPGENQSRFEPVQNLIIEESLAVGGYRLSGYLWPVGFFGGHALIALGNLLP